MLVVSREAGSTPREESWTFLLLGAENYKKSRRRCFAQPTEAVQYFDYGSVATKKNTSIFRFERFQTSIRRTSQIAFGWPFEVVSVKASLEKSNP